MTELDALLERLAAHDKSYFELLACQRDAYRMLPEVAARLKAAEVRAEAAEASPAMRGQPEVR